MRIESDQPCKKEWLCIFSLLLMSLANRQSIQLPGITKPCYKLILWHYLRTVADNICFLAKDSLVGYPTDLHAQILRLLIEEALSDFHEVDFFCYSSLLVVNNVWLHNRIVFIK